MGSENAFTYRFRRHALARAALVIVLGGCASAQAGKVHIDTPPNTYLNGFGRVLVAGFLSDGADAVDLNRETTRFLRMQLRSKTSMWVIESEPLPLGDSSNGEPDRVFTNTGLWRRLGEEYSDPLIVTGTVEFRSAASRYEQRTAGRQTVRLWRPGFSLRLRLVLIDGRSGDVIESAPFRQVTATARTGREGAVSLFFRLMDQMVPSILTAIGQGSSQSRVLLR